MATNLTSDSQGIYWIIALYENLTGVTPDCKSHYFNQFAVWFDNSWIACRDYPVNIQSTSSRYLVDITYSSHQIRFVNKSEQFAKTWLSDLYEDLSKGISLEVLLRSSQRETLFDRISKGGFPAETPSKSFRFSSLNFRIYRLFTTYESQDCSFHLD